VFFASLDQSIYAFDLSGRQRWRVRTERPLTVTPTYHAGVLYAPSEDRGLRAIDALTGAELWAQPRVDGRVVAMRGGRLLVFGDAVATLLDPDTGDVVFTTPLPAVQSLHTDRFEDGYLYAVSTGGIVARFEPRR
jgi:outer membrane protein assembly factor BamB